MWTSVLIFNLLYCMINAITYNTYYGVPATEEEIADFTERNIADICTVTFNACNESELRRADGSCNNLNFPSHGTYHTRQWRMLPAHFGENFEPRLMSTGKRFPPARYIRQTLVKLGDGVTVELSTAGSFFIEFVTNDIVSIHDIRNVVFINTWCCGPEGLEDYMCTPNKIPADDNVHRFSNIRCNNNTRPISFQTTGCVPNDTVPARINYVTTHFDLSMAYGFMGVSLNETRAFYGGRLKVEHVNGQIYASGVTPTNNCTIVASKKTGCAMNVPNALLGFNLFTTWFWRHHNVIADALTKQNPCWDDERLFRVAMDINIAYYTNIVFYEYLALVLGKQNLIDEGILQAVPGYRDVYDESIIPALSMESIYALRWFHNIQDARQRMYDQKDNYVRSRSVVNFTASLQDLPFDDNMLQITRGIILQPSGGFDDTVHPDIADIGFGQFQQAFDILTADLAKGRFFGLPSYLEYRDLCTNYTISHKSFDNLTYLIGKSKIELLKRIYPTAKDIEVLAGMWAEKIMPNAWVPPTVYCMLVAQLKKSVKSDRYWYERPNRPNAFNKKQLKQITASSFAGLLCAVGDGITEIQPKAFLTIGPGNEKVSCKKIPKLDLTLWKDTTCTY